MLMTTGARRCPFARMGDRAAVPDPFAAIKDMEAGDLAERVLIEQCRGKALLRL